MIFEVCQDLVDMYKQAALWGKSEMKQHVAVVVEAPLLHPRQKHLSQGREAQEPLARPLKHLQAL